MLYNEYNLELSGQAIRNKDKICSLNIMVIGDTGLGKTTFVRRFYNTIKDTIIKNTFKETIPNIISDPLQTTKNPYTISMHIKQQQYYHQHLFLSILDTPGFNSKLSMDQQLLSFTEYIDHQYEQTFTEETKLKRDTKRKDSHIHACLYFINATCINSLTDKDLYMMKQLANRVNVIPIIGKTNSTTANKQQLDHFKIMFRHCLFDLFQYPLYGFIHLDEDGDEDRDEDEGNNDNRYDQPQQSLKQQNNHDICFNQYNSGSKKLDQIIEALISYPKQDEDEEDEIIAMIDYLKNIPLHFVEKSKRKTTTADDNHGDNQNKNQIKTIEQQQQLNCCQFEKLIDLLLLKHRDLLRIDTYKRFYEQYRINKLLNQQIRDIILIKSRGKKIVLK
ncbi:Septin-domain-containing protein [Cunninghamella echinulata]|nr:Septin-domain-containing protein [Cunninghamella echinulata]